MPALVADVPKVQPSGVGSVPDLPHQAMALELIFEELLEDGQALSCLHGVKAQSRPGFRRSLHDERAQLRAYSVGSRPQPAATGLDKMECEGVKYLIRAQPNIFILAHPDVSTEIRIRLSYSTTRPIGREDQIGLRQLGCAQHLVAMLDAYTELLRPSGKESRHIRPVKIVHIPAAVIQYSLTAYTDELLVPDEGGLLDLSRRLGVISVKLLQQTGLERYSPAEA